MLEGCNRTWLPVFPSKGDAIQNKKRQRASNLPPGRKTKKLVSKDFYGKEDISRSCGVFSEKHSHPSVLAK